MNKRGIVGIIISMLAIIVAIALIIYFFAGGNNDNVGIEEDDGQGTAGGNEDQGTIIENAIEMTSAGFSPAVLEINRGETVTFINKDTDEHWPASAMHPTHRVYPGSDIAKCGTDEAETIFDACRPLLEGEEYSFTFNEVGEWSYHDHLNPENFFGKIVVR